MALSSRSHVALSARTSMLLVVAWEHSRVAGSYSPTIVITSLGFAASSP